jgi:two-component system chemotaxis response regulator CheY
MARILICEDSKFVRKMIADILKSGNHEVVGEAINGQEAIEKYAEFKPDIVTMDILMKPDGHTAIKKIKTIDPKAKIIIVTSLVDANGEVVQSVRLGAEGFVGKPINPNLLLNEITRILSQDKPAE